MNANLEAKLAGTQAFVANDSAAIGSGFAPPAVATPSSPAPSGWSAAEARGSLPAVVSSQKSFGHEPTIVDVLKARAASHSDRDAYLFLSYRGDDTDEERLTYAALYSRAKANAAALQAVANPGDRVLIVCPPGFDYIASFFGCLLAGMVAVPAYPPRNAKHMPRLQAILADAGAAAVLAPHDLHPRLARWAIGTRKLPPFVSSDRTSSETAAAFRETPVLLGDLAFLQYTSGTTGSPKGVMVTHAQAMENVRQIIRFGSLDEGDFGMVWLPPYHDMGLVGGLLVPPVAAFPVVLMSPASFVQRPARCSRRCRTTMRRSRRDRTSATSSASMRSMSTMSPASISRRCALHCPARSRYGRRRCGPSPSDLLPAASRRRASYPSTAWRRPC
jgi:AMP-binding enzyme